MSKLPQELVDRIIDQVHDRKSLKACCLVCSQWSVRSRKHLFARVEFADVEDLQRWCARIHPGPSGLSSLVEDLSLSECIPPVFIPSWLDLYDFSDAAPHLQSFSGLRVLKIWRWRMSTDRVSLKLHSFGSSLENVTHLVLRDVSVHPLTLAMFVSHFPRLDDLSLFGIHPVMFDGTDDLHRRLRADIVQTHPGGKLSVAHRPTDRSQKGVFEAITLLEPRFQKIVLTNIDYDEWRDYWPLVEACGGSLEELKILVGTMDAECNGLSLACCPNLRKITLSLGHGKPPRPCQFVEKCLSTITSTQLSEVSLRLRTGRDASGPPRLNLELWDPLDIILYNLAGKYRQEYEGDKMQVELVNVNPDPSEAGFLWRYRERGTWRTKSKTWSDYLERML